MILNINKPKPKKTDKEHTCETEFDEVRDYEEVTKIFIPEDNSSRTVGMYGEINDEKAFGLISAFYSLKERGTNLPKEEKYIDFMISSEGGVLVDALSIYDMMRIFKKEIPIGTIGVGKVMSAALLLLAAGTKGKRRITRNCRLMIHPVSAGHFGKIHDLHTNMKETQILQEIYVKELSALTKLTKKKINDLFLQKSDIHFDAKQALSWGIVDEII